MKNKKDKEAEVYSRLDLLPRHHASAEYTEGVLALEGGAFRGVYTSGVLDCLMLNNINLSTTVGVSAGALNGVNYTSGQIGRSALCNLKYRHDSRWVGGTALRTDKGVIGFHFLYDGFEEDYPFDHIAFADKRRRFVAVATNLRTGQPEYYDSSIVNLHLMNLAVAASASMPYVSAPVQIGYEQYLDGGCATKLPLGWALDQGQKTVFVATRPVGFRRPEKSPSDKLIRAFYPRYPEFCRALENTSARYNADSDLADRLVAEGSLFRIAPSEPVTVSRLEGDMEKLGALYWLGYHDADRQLPALKEYLGIKG